MENTTDNKEKFFGLYHKQQVLRFHDNDMLGIVYTDLARKETSYLELTPLSLISDTQVAELGFRNRIEFIAMNEDTKYLIVPIADKLRSWGFAIDWNGLTVEQQVEYNWIRLKD